MRAKGGKFPDYLRYIAERYKKIVEASMCNK